MLPSRSHWLAAAFLTSSVVVGGAAGWLLKGWTAGRARQDRDPNTTIAYLTTQLGLTGDQQDSIRTILELRRMKMDSIWRQTRPGIDSLRAVMQVEVEEELTPAQRVRFRELMAWNERQRDAADSASQASWDGDDDRVPQRIDKCQNTPRGTQVDASGCAAQSVRNGGT